MSDGLLPVVLAMTGASGAAYGLRLLEALLHAGCEVHVTVSPAALQVLQTELGPGINPRDWMTPRTQKDAAAGADSGGSAAVGFQWPAGADGYQFRPLRPPVANGSLSVAAGPTAAVQTVSGQTVSVQNDSRQIGPGRVRVYDHRDFQAGIASGSFRTAGMVVCPCSMGTLGALAHGLSQNLIHRAADVHLKERRPLILVPRETPLSSIQLDNLKRLSDAGAVVMPAMPGFYHQPQSLGDLVDFVVARILDHLKVPHQLTRRWGADRD